MPNKCKWFLCKSNAVGKSIYCIPHGRIYDDSVAVEQDKPIPKESKKEKELKKPRKERYKLFLAKHKKCKAKFSKNCAGVASVIHHLKGRTPAVVDDETFWLPCCPICNGEIEERHEDAVNAGLKISQHRKEPLKNHDITPTAQ